MLLMKSLNQEVKSLEMQYDKSIAHLEEEVSYGVLGVINTLVKLLDEPRKWQLFLINVGTFVRNNYDKSSSDKDIIAKIHNDVNVLNEYILRYLNGQDATIVYYFSDQRRLVPEEHMRTATPSRIRMTSIMDQLIKDNSLPRKQLYRMNGEDDPLNILGYQDPKAFPHNYLTDIIKYSKTSNSCVLLTHNSLDLLMMSKVDDITLLSSHTGKLLTTKEVAQKVFKVDEIPLNTVTIKLFGDKDNVIPIIKNKKKALKLLSNKNLHLLTEREMYRLALTVLKVEKRRLDYKL